MARAGERDLAVELSAVADVCRAKGIVKAMFINGQLAEILMGPPPPAPKGTKSEVDDRAAKRAHYENLLGRPVSNVELDNLP